MAQTGVHEQEASIKEPKEQSSQSSEEDVPSCRFCLEAGGKLVSPCNCKGGSKWVHFDCLRKWQRMAQLNKASHPWYNAENAAKHQHICTVCKHPFNVEAPSFDEVVSGLTGEEIVNQVSEGYMIVASTQSSEQWKSDLASNSHLASIRESLPHWIGSVYLITGVSIRGKHEGQDRICAVNLTSEMETPASYYKELCERIVGKKKVDIRYLGSGPCDALHAVGCLRATSKQYVEENTELTIMDGSADSNSIIVSGSLFSVVNTCHYDWVKQTKEREASGKSEELPKRLVLACFGDATWTRTELLGDIAKGGFGLALFKASDVFAVAGEAQPPSIDKLFQKIHEAKRVLGAGENEMSRAFEEPTGAMPFEDTEQAREHREKLRQQLLENSSNSRPPAGRPAGRPRANSISKDSISKDSLKTEDMDATTTGTFSGASPMEC